MAGSLVAILILLYVAHLLASCQVYTDSCFWHVRSVCTDVGDWKCSVHVTEFHDAKKVSTIFPLLNVGDILDVCLSVCTHVHAHNLQWTGMVQMLLHLPDSKLGWLHCVQENFCS